MLTAKKSIGNFGELLARDFLTARGYQVIEHNKKIGRWEIDLITRITDLTVFVEVKTLSGYRMAPAEEALTRRQIEILKKAIRLYCWRNRINPAQTRLDFISININLFTKSAKIKHYRDIE
ncbi:MAG: YraN family protein [Patescibacteria group bacterium]|nr:YraN family protein [Patescibacteria group bacterium]